MPFSEVEMSYGSTLSYSTTAAGSYTAVAGVRSVEWRGSRPSANATALADVATVYKRKRRDPGTLSCEARYEKTAYDFLHDTHVAGTELYWKVTTGAGAVLGPFFGHIMELGFIVPEDEVISYPLSIQCSGGGTTPDTFTPNA